VRENLATVSVERAGEILRAIAATRVGVVGDAMLDRYVWGVVSRISPEAPVPVVDITEETVRLGGAANVANNVVSMGAACDLFSIIGDDTVGRELLRDVEGSGIGVKGLVCDPTRPTTIKTRVIAHNQQVVRTDRENRDEISGGIEAEFRQRVIESIPGIGAFIISDYGKGVITKRLLDEMIPKARSAGRIVSVDPKEDHFKNYKQVSLITPNQFEAGGAMGRRIHDEESLLEVGWEIVGLLDTDALLITRGEHGMSLFQKDGTYTHFPTVARHVYDVTGAGDTVICAFTLALCAGATMDEAAQIANHAAGLVIRDVGTATVRPQDLIDSFSDDDEVGG
jgi:rfaE bifunctional protein kinase chain/domain